MVVRFLLKVLGGLALQSLSYHATLWALEFLGLRTRAPAPLRGFRREVWVSEDELELIEQLEEEGGDHVAIAFKYFDEIFKWFDEHKKPRKK